jgi:DNA-directed RNA polymerase alpha subunit
MTEHLRTPIEELDLSIRAYNTLKACGVGFVDEIRPLLDSREPAVSSNANLRRVRLEIEDRLRASDDDADGSGVPSRL